MMRSMKFRLAVATAAALLASGCGGSLLQSDAPPPETYRLGSVPGPAQAAPAVAGGRALPGLTVARPRAAAALDSERIAVVSGGNRFDYYAGVRWAEPAPQMLQQNLVAALARSGRFAGVFAAPARVPSELTLDVECRRFEADATGGTPVVHVVLQASLVDVQRGRRVSSFTSEAAVAAAGGRRAEIIAAFDRATAEVVGDVVSRVAEAAATVPAN